MFRNTSKIIVHKMSYLNKYKYKNTMYDKEFNDIKKENDKIKIIIKELNMKHDIFKRKAQNNIFILEIQQLYSSLVLLGVAYLMF